MLYRALVVGFAWALFAGITPVAKASIQTGDIIKFGDGPGSPGGVFFINDTSGNKLFDSFCVQLEEYISFGSNKSYLVQRHDALATAGVGSRSLTPFAAWLYNSYLDESPELVGFDYSIKYDAGNAAAAQQASELQLAIWVGMGYTRADIGTGWYDAYEGSLADWQDAFDVSGWIDTGDIYIMNLLGLDSGGEYTVHSQDQLVRIPPGPDPNDGGLPEPLSLVVWSVLAIGGLGACKLRRITSPNA